MIPFNEASFQGKELDYISDSINVKHISGDGKYTKLCQKFLEDRIGVKRALLTTSCTDALEMCSILLDIQPGDEIIVPSFTFVSTVNAFVLRGAVPVFIDIRRDTLNIDDGALEDKITEKTKAIVVVHYAGVACEMDRIIEIAQKHKVPVIEDNAHGLFAKYNGRYLGTIGSLATLSFHETKNFTCGEGGSLLINDKSLIERSEIIRDKGTNRSKFFRGQVDKYTWVDVGSSFLPSDILAAFLYAQLENVDKIQTSRRIIWDRYFNGLSEWADESQIRLPYVPSNCEQSYHMFYIVFPDLVTRTEFIAHMKREQISTVFHYLPLHLSEMGLRFGGKKGDCPLTEDISDRLLRLPFYNDLCQSDQDYVITKIKDFSR